MLVDVLFDPFEGRWPDVLAGAVEAGRAGFDGVWMYDHLAGSVHGASRVLECWTTLTAIAALVPRIAVGPLVLNVANRDPGTLAMMAATLQEVSGGRLLLGIGAGSGRETPYADEQRALGRPVPGAAIRRRTVEEHARTLKDVWAGRVRGASGFLRPEPPPPIIVGGFGPKMAELAGRAGDGINTPAGPGLPRLIEVARNAHAAAGHDPQRFVVTASASASLGELERLEALGVHRAVIFVRPPYAANVQRAAAAMKR